jgi:hypothetical protein
MAKSGKSSVPKSASVKGKATKKSVPAKKSAGGAKHQFVKGGGGGGGAAHMVILNTVASMKVFLQEACVEREKLSFLTKINGKSTIANALTKLKSYGWMEVTPTTVTITDEGMKNVDQEELAKGQASIPTSNEQHWDRVKEQFHVKGTKLALMEELQDGRSHSKKEVLIKVFGKMNSTSANACTDMKKNGIIVYDKDTIRLDDKMFPVEPRRED